VSTPSLTFYPSTLPRRVHTNKQKQARDILEALVEEGSSFHALTFNLSTIYELCTERSRALKIGLAEKIAGMGSKGEKANADFKL